MRVQPRPAGFTGAGSGQSPPRLNTGTPHPYYVLLFGKRPPPLVDRRQHPKLKKALQKLGVMRDQLSELMGVAEETFSLQLCEGSNASVSEEGEIRLGVKLLEQHKRDDDLLLAVMAHEMGHTPWDWDPQALVGLSRAHRDALLRAEEAKADRFMAKALADLGASVDPICDFLLAAEAFESAPSTEYDPAEVRVRLIRETYRRRKRSLREAAQFNPRAEERARELR